MLNLIVGDVHWSQNSSIVRGMGARYSKRLENLIESVNWAEALAEERKVGRVVYLGDFFDRPELNSMEITALGEVRWSSAPHVFLVGNHEASTASLEFNSVNALAGRGFTIVSSPERVGGVLCLPYMAEGTAPSLRELVGDGASLVVSHNDVKGIRYGAVVSQRGFPLEDIGALRSEGLMGLMVNGHIHNRGEFGGYLVDLGNLTGQNFSEDAERYPHCVMLIDDADPSAAEYVENPHALNFYKLEFPSMPKALKGNAVLSVKAKRSDAEAVSGYLDGHSGSIAACKMVWQPEPMGKAAAKSLGSVDHLAMFREYALSELGGSADVAAELSEVLG